MELAERLGVRIGGGPFGGAAGPGAAAATRVRARLRFFLRRTGGRLKKAANATGSSWREQAWRLLEAQGRNMAASSGHRGVNAGPHLGPRQPSRVAPWMTHGRMPEWT